MDETSHINDIDEGAYTASALKLIRKAVKGNGVRVASVELQSFDGANIVFDAVTHVSTGFKISNKSMPGRVSGGIVLDSPQAVQKAAGEHAAGALQDAGVVAEVKRLILERADKGFGLDDEAVKLPFLDKVFMSHVVCGPCSGKGRIRCAQCRGLGVEPCMNCSAEGFTMCPECSGNRQVRGPQGNMQPCNRCQSLGKVSCSFCRESRNVQCRVCKTQKEVQCKGCGGHGASSEIANVAVVGQCTAEYDIRELPEKAAMHIGEVGAKLSDYADVDFIPDAADVPIEGGVMHLHYRVQMPQGSAVFSLKKTSVDAYLFGKQGEIKDIPDFLDGMLKGGMQQLSKAASGQGNVLEHVRLAIKYKTLKQAIGFVVRYNLKKSMQALMHYTPVGLSKNAAKKIIIDANAALNHATKQQRMIAIVVGVLIAAVMIAGYFLSPVRGAVLSGIANVALHVPVDVLVVLVCAGVGGFVWKTLSVSARKKVLKSIM